jgi:hypothetical protein
MGSVQHGATLTPRCSAIKFFRAERRRISPVHNFADCQMRSRERAVGAHSLATTVHDGAGSRAERQRSAQQASQRAARGSEKPRGGIGRSRGPMVLLHDRILRPAGWAIAVHDRTLSAAGWIPRFFDRLARTCGGHFEPQYRLLSARGWAIEAQNGLLRAAGWIPRLEPGHRQVCSTHPAIFGSGGEGLRQPFWNCKMASLRSSGGRVIALQEGIVRPENALLRERMAPPDLVGPSRGWLFATSELRAIRTTVMHGNYAGAVRIRPSRERTS